MILFIRILLAGTILYLWGCSNGVLNAARSAQETSDSSSVTDSATETENNTPTDVSTETEPQIDTDTNTDSVLTLYQIIGEAEAFSENNSTSTHQWVLVNADYDGSVVPDADTDHLPDASGGAYLEALPDNHTSDADTAGTSTVNPANAPQVKTGPTGAIPGDAIYNFNNCDCCFSRGYSYAALSSRKKVQPFFGVGGGAAMTWTNNCKPTPHSSLANGLPFWAFRY